MIEAWAKSEDKQIRLMEYVDRMEEDRKDIFAFPLNLPMLALNCMRGGLHGVSVPGQSRGLHVGRADPLFSIGRAAALFTSASPRLLSKVCCAWGAQLPTV